MEIRIIFDNYPAEEGWKWGWGFSALIGDDLLFDTGSDPEDELKNLQKVTDPSKIKEIVISHSHWDHTGGLLALVNKSPHVKIYVGGSFSGKFEEELKRKGANVERGSGWRKLREKIWIGPELPEPVPEQFLTIEGKDRVLLIGGCSHPGIENFALLTQEKFHKPLYIMGGFHLFSSTKGRIREVAEKLKNLKVEKAYPSHCTGEKAYGIFSDYFQVEKAGSGKVVNFP